MSLEGTRIGPYEIGPPIGAGGMGEVFRARDTHLGRDVAIKLLPENLVHDPERAARFRREAQVVASLNHPNIAAIFGFDESVRLALALELVEGEDLATRLTRGPLPLDEALSIARQLVDGLEAAHDKGVVHRDFKPANVKITPDGAAKILDFGLAKALAADGADRDADLANSPTVAREMTGAGVVLGTAAYMSPEQARGKPVDKRADIWAFGVVLYEMLTGHRLFTGDTASDILAAVLTRDPDWTRLPASTPPSVRHLLMRCLERDVRSRLRDIGDAREDLTCQEVSIPAEPPSRRVVNAVPWILAAIAIALAVWTWWRSGAGVRGTAPRVMHAEIGYPPHVEPVSGMQGGYAVSRDGTMVAMIGVRDGVRRLFVRRLDRAEAVEIGDSAGVNSAAFAPDSGSIVFIPASSVVTRVSLGDQQRAVVAAGADLGSGVSWGEAGILYTRNGEIWMAPLDGKERQLTRLDSARGEVLHSDAIFIPATNTVLFSSLATERGTERIEALDVQSGARRVVVDRANTPVLTPDGQLLFSREGAVWATEFETRTSTVRGKAVRVIAPGTVGTIRSGSLGLQVASNGTLVYVPANFDDKRIVSVGRDGAEIPLALAPSRYNNPRVSPDGRTLLVEREWSVIDTIDLQRGTRAILTASASGTSFSTWTSDSRGVVYRRFNVPFFAAADGSGRSNALASALINDYPSSPGPEPDLMIMVRIQPKTSGDIFLFSISGRFPPKPLLTTPPYEGGPQLSPDGRWLLYQSNASGQPEIYVRRYPQLDREWQVSEDGGVQTRWSRDGREIYYRNGKNMMGVAFKTDGAGPSFGKPVPLFADDFDYGQGISIANYDVTTDGRFIMLRRGSQGGTLRVVIGWTEELRKILAAGGV